MVYYLHFNSPRLTPQKPTHLTEDAEEMQRNNYQIAITLDSISFI